MSPSIADLVRLDSVCDAFEESWKAGSRPRLEEYLESTNLPSATLFVELVQIDIDYRRRHGETPSVGEYAAKFPQFEEALSEIASLLGTTDATVSVPAKPLPMLGRFELAAELGRGSFGVVWKAWDTKMRRWVALKQFHEGIARGNRKLYEREARAVAQLDHPNVVRVLELSEGSSSDYIVFELIEGESLKSWLAAREGKPVDPRLAAEIVLQIAQGLQHVHERDIVHRDLKPGNILITKEGVPKLVDFGLARHLDSLSTIAHDKSLLGTIPYMSPEQCRAQSVTPATDIYSLGVILYELLAGYRPFSGSQSEILAQIQYKIPPSLDPAKGATDLEVVFRRAMEKEPIDRYISASGLAEDLERFLKREPLPKYSTWNWRRMGRRIGRRDFLVWTTGGAALAAAIWAQTDRKEPDDGRERVLIRTKPVGAELHIIPIDSQTGLPIPDQIMKVPDRSPATVRLFSGDYLVVAALDGGERFHEVLRHVPSRAETSVRQGMHVRWYRLDDGSIELPAFLIPPKEVTEDMTYFEGEEKFFAGKRGSDSTPGHFRRMDPFYLDRAELTVEQYVKVLGDPPQSRKWKMPPTSKHAISVTWDQAVLVAELLGKRLITEYEYEYAATNGGRQLYSWGEEPVPSFSNQKEFLPSGQPAADAVGDPPVYGLGSNLAEWTSSLPHATVPASGTPSQRVVRGGGGTREVIEGLPSVDAARRDPRDRLLVESQTLVSGLGVRFGRSAKPRINPNQFASS